MAARYMGRQEGRAVIGRAQLQLEQLAGGQERNVERRARDPHARQVGLDALATHEPEQVVGRGVVADGDHLSRHLGDGELGAVGLVLQHP